MNLPSFAFLGYDGRQSPQREGSEVGVDGKG